MNGIIHADILEWIHHYGYFGLTGLLVLGIVGLPLPDETLLMAVGYLVYRGKMLYVPSLLAGIAGGVVGITISYALGVLIGYALLLHAGRIFHLNEKRLQMTEKWLDKYGGYALFGGFFIPGVRHAAAIVAGLGNMSFARFAFFSYLGATVWVIVFITLGRFAGPHVERVSLFLHHELVWAIGVGLLALIALAIAGWRFILGKNRLKQK